VSGPWLQHPAWLAPVLAGLVAAGLALALAGARARRRCGLLVGARAPRPGMRTDALLWLALAALGVALLGPRLGWREARIPAGGVDVVLLLDVSHSMTAADTPPSRLRRAQRAAGEVLARLGPGDRAALAAFAGHGVLLSPLTSDAIALAELLVFLDETLIGAGGSDAADGIATALSAFEGTPGARPRAILLLSDGEDPSRRGADDAAALAARAGVRIVSAAFGSEAGAPLRGLPPSRTAGRIVVSRRDAPALARLARATDGAAFEADPWGELDAAALVAALRRGTGVAAAAAGAEARGPRVPAVRVAPFAALAFALLLLEVAGLRAGGRLRRAAPGLAAALLLVGGAPGRELPRAPAPSALEAELRRRPGDAETLVWLGLARAERGEGAEAERAFAAAALLARDPALAALAWHDLGVLALAAGELERARDAFFAAASLDPGRRASVFNLEWTLEALATRPPETAGGGEPDEAEDAPSPDAQPEPGPEPGTDAPDARAEARAAEPAPDARDEPTPGKDAPPLPTLSDAEARRWLDAAPDDAARALRGAAARAGELRPPARGPAW
jgi:Ca-activated chloride channel family protein